MNEQSERGAFETARAEEMVDAMSQAVGAFTADMGHRLLKATALAREEVEDIWAEAQSLAHNGQGQN